MGDLPVWNPCHSVVLEAVPSDQAQATGRGGRGSVYYRQEGGDWNQQFNCGEHYGGETIDRLAELMPEDIHIYIQ